jgi:acyl carrier protein
MEMNDFINNFVSQLEIPPVEPVTGETDFRSLDAWDSLTALSIMAMVDDEYGVTLTGEDIKKSNTINDLFKIVEKKKK